MIFEKDETVTFGVYLDHTLDKTLLTGVIWSKIDGQLGFGPLYRVYTSNGDGLDTIHYVLETQIICKGTPSDLLKELLIP